MKIDSILEISSDRGQLQELFQVYSHIVILNQAFVRSQKYQDFKLGLYENDQANGRRKNGHEISSTTTSPGLIGSATC